MVTFDDDLRLAHVLADAVERTTLDLFRSPDLEVQRRDDGGLVTQADAQAERMLRHQLSRSRPRDVVQGEELATTGHGSRRWVLDPIDGTAAYVRGVPVWATLIALMVEDRPALGLVAAPALARRWWAAAGSGAWTGRSLSSARRIHVSDTSVVEHAVLSCDTLGGWASHPRAAGFLRLADRCWQARAYGDFWSHALVAEGAVDLAADPARAEHHLAALSAVVTEAGGRLGDLDGVDGPSGGSALSSNGVLHDAALYLLNDGLDEGLGEGLGDGLGDGLDEAHHDRTGAGQ